MSRSTSKSTSSLSFSSSPAHVPSPRACSRRRSRRLLGTAGLIALAVAALPGSASALNLSTVNILSVENGAPDEFLDGIVVSNGQTLHYTKEDLNADLPGIPSNEVMIQYWSDSQSAEVHVFSFDPALISDLVRITGSVQLVTDDAGLQFNPYVQTPILSQDVFMPYDVVVPYPNEDTVNLIPGAPPLPAEVFLDKTKFAGAPPHSLIGPAADPGSAGSIKAIRIYDHGQCAAGTSLKSMYNELQDTAWCKFKSVARSEGVDLLRWYTHGITMLDRAPNSFPDGVEDGFFLNGHFTVVITDPIADIDVRVMSESTFGLEKGHLVVHPKQDIVLTSDSDIQDAVDGALSTLRTSIAQRADQAQSVGIGACNVGALDPCFQPRTLLEDLVEDGAKYLMDHHMEELSGSEIEDMKKLVAEESSWTCDTGKDVIDKIIAGDECNPVTDEDLARLSNPTCRFFVPASRLNVYPNELELVWFDGKDTSNPAYALWVALQSPFAPQGASEQLCASQQADHTDEDYYTREYAVSRRGVMLMSQEL